MINGIFGKKIIDSMKIFILGTNGMLGRYVKTYFKQFYNIVELNKDILDASKITEERLTKIFQELNYSKGDIVINCIGTIKPMVDSLGDKNAILVNSVFPRILSDVCESLNMIMIHPTTDCVYDGKIGNYNENSIHDITDVYGRTKSLGEPKNCMVIRTSIIGEEVNGSRSLVEWAKSQNGKKVNGFLDHLWNGVTCLEWSKFVHNVIKTNGYWTGVRHISSPSIVNKSELLKMLSNSFNLNLEVQEINSGNPIDRTISSIFNQEFKIQELSEQIKEMKEYSIKLFND